MPQPLTKVGIANLGLQGLLGQKPIPLTDTTWTTTNEAIKAKSVWETARLSTLRDHAWKFARRRIELTAVAAPNLDTYIGWDYVWAYPSSTHLVRKVFIDSTSANPDPIEFALFNGEISNLDRIATNEVDGDGKCYAECTYTGEGTADAQYLTYDPQAALALAAQLAYLLALPLTGNENKAKQMLQIYANAISRAKATDALEERILSVRKSDSDFLIARG
jgi:hypothetical protein